MKLEYNEQDIQQALNAITNGMSQRKAELEYGVPRATLQNRMKGHISRQEAHVPQQRLSTVQEQRLAEWVLVQESLGLAPTHGQIRAFAGRILLDAKPTMAISEHQGDNFFLQAKENQKHFRIQSTNFHCLPINLQKSACRTAWH
jgi:hypothetical protein